MGHNLIVLSLDALQKFKDIALNPDHPQSNNFVEKAIKIV